jgi:predicted nuclease of restriction endonuclease-like (RecB) superfamily
MLKPTKEYKYWLQQLKQRIRSSQVKAAIHVNTELLNLYWELGKEIIEKEKEIQWGEKLIEQLSKDLLAEFPEMKGFSVTNLYYIKRWFLFYNQPGNPILPQLVAELPKNKKLPQPVAKSAASKKLQQPMPLIVPQLVAQIPWGHHREIITKCKKIEEAIFYISETSKNNWSRAVLVHQMEVACIKERGRRSAILTILCQRHKAIWQKSY